MVSNPTPPISTNPLAVAGDISLGGGHALVSGSSGAGVVLDTGGAADGDIVFAPATSGTRKGFRFGNGPIGFFNTVPVTQQTPVGSRGANAALTSLLTALAATGLIVDGTSA